MSLPAKAEEEWVLAYGVAWRSRNDTVASGSLALEATELVLRGTANGGDVLRERVPLGEITRVRIGRAQDECVRGQRSVILERRDGSTLPVAPLGTAGAVFELADLLAELSAKAGAAATARAQVVVVLPLRPGTAARARELAAGGPPFDLERADLERHHVFVTEREAIFVFEGADAYQRVERLLRDPRVLRDAARWGECIAGRPRLAREAYAWSRED